MAPVAKLTSSWQAPQAARLGLVYQALACAAPVVDSWHSAQRRGSEGRTTVDQSVVPMAYFPPATTLGKLAAHVNLVGHHLHVHGLAGSGFTGLRLVAHDAKLQAAARTAVEGELIVALVAGRGLDDLARGGLSAGRHPVVDGGGVVGAEVELGEVAIAVDSHAMGRGGVVAFGQFGGVGVDVLAVADLGLHAAGIAGGLGDGDLAVGGTALAGHVGT